MSHEPNSPAEGYEAIYRDFDSPLMQRLRGDAYGEDIGQHSWVRAAELRDDMRRLRLSSTSRFLDLGCGPGGPLTFVLSTVGCYGTGLERSSAALAVGRTRAARLGVEHRLTLLEADLDDPLPVQAATFDAATALDVVLHLRDRGSFYREVARALLPKGRFLVTDAGVRSGPLTSEEARRRRAHGSVEFVEPGVNEALLESSGFRLLETEDRTASVVRNAGGRLAAAYHLRTELEDAWGEAEFRAQEDYLKVVIELAERRAVSRILYLAEVVSP